MEMIMPYMNLIIGAAVVLAILLVGTMIYRSLNKRVRGRKGQRLGIVEYHEIDETRRLVLLRRDETEHLVLIGGPQDLVVEAGIKLDSNIEDLDEPPLPLRAPIPLRPTQRAPAFAERRQMLRPVDPPAMSTRNMDRDDV
jgi:Flagellar biosynthesis protein, FliO